MKAVDATVLFSGQFFWRSFRALGFSVFLVWTFYVAYQWFIEPGRFPMRRIEIHGTFWGSMENEVKEALEPSLKEGFFTLRLKECKNEILKLSWVREVDLERRWPDRLIVTVVEHRPIARYGDREFISAEGVLFFLGNDIENDIELKSYFGDLPRWEGPRDALKEMVKQYFYLLEVLHPLGLNMSNFILDQTHCWKFRLSSGLDVVLGKSELTERINRFALAYRVVIGSKISRIAYVDLRYTNGVAIGWKAGVKDKHIS